MQRAVLVGDAFDGHDLLAFAMFGQHDAGVDGKAIEQYGTRAAIAVGAADFDVQVAFAPQHVEQRVGGLADEFLRLHVDCHMQIHSEPYSRNPFTQAECGTNNT